MSWSESFYEENGRIILQNSFPPFSFHAKSSPVLCVEIWVVWSFFKSLKIALIVCVYILQASSPVVRKAAMHSFATRWRWYLHPSWRNMAFHLTGQVVPYLVFLACFSFRQPLAWYTVHIVYIAKFHERIFYCYVDRVYTTHHYMQSSADFKLRWKISCFA